MAELQPDQKIERKDLAFMRVATQHQVDLALRSFPYRRLVDEGKIEGALTGQLFDSSCSRQYRLLVAHTDQIDAAHLCRRILEHLDVQLGKPQQQPLETPYISLMVAGHEIDFRIQPAECRNVIQLEVTAVEQVTTNQKPVKFQCCLLYTSDAADE